MTTASELRAHYYNYSLPTDVRTALLLAAQDIEIYECELECACADLSEERAMADRLFASLNRCHPGIHDPDYLRIGQKRRKVLQEWKDNRSALRDGKV